MRRMLTLVTEQLPLELDRPPASAEELLVRLREMGLSGIDRCLLTHNRSVMISFRRGVLRLNRGYLSAPFDVHRAIVTFVSGRTRKARREAQRVILEHPIPLHEMRARRDHMPRPRPSDIPLMEALVRSHEHYNAMLFGGQLSRIAIRISGRMRNRLGQYSAPCASGRPAEITISRRHIRRHGWEEALHTLLHEMVHQWQAENGMPIDHGREFRRKAREVGVEPTARRVVVRDEIRKQA
ncbi:MAG TPA: SprT-like domain-containing protein [Gemmatimonadaceae bacterium]|nr:SprT-like domain-containing protein [Gemmatimonadaceae bacterium]